MIPKQHFRGVIWPRPEKDSCYRYVVVGMLVTDTPIENFSGNDTICLDGKSFQLMEALSAVEQTNPGVFPVRGDANSVLLRLNRWDCKS